MMMIMLNKWLWRINKFFQLLSRYLIAFALFQYILLLYQLTTIQISTILFKFS